jgi:hypothetical protein
VDQALGAGRALGDFAGCGGVEALLGEDGRRRIDQRLLPRGFIMPPWRKAVARAIRSDGESWQMIERHGIIPPRIRYRRA